MKKRTVGKLSFLHVPFMCLFMPKYYLDIQLPRNRPYLNYALLCYFLLQETGATGFV